MEFVKHFCRLVTELDISDDDVIEYFDIVQSVVPVKMVTAHTEDDGKVEVVVTEYTGDNDLHIYEIILNEQINLEEGELISDMLGQEFDYDFEFETSMEI
jgi:hypothetical protein